jgi:hypothetical protein
MRGPLEGPGSIKWGFFGGKGKKVKRGKINIFAQKNTI